MDQRATKLSPNRETDIFNADIHKKKGKNMFSSHQFGANQVLHAHQPIKDDKFDLCWNFLNGDTLLVNAIYKIWTKTNPI